MLTSRRPEVKQLVVKPAIAFIQVVVEVKGGATTARSDSFHARFARINSTVNII